MVLGQCEPVRRVVECRELNVACPSLDVLELATRERELSPHLHERQHERAGRQ